MKKLLLMLVALSCILGGCANYRQISLEDVQLGKIKMAGMTKADVGFRLLVNNPTKATFTVEDITGMVYKEGVEFARISMFEPFQVAPGTPSGADATLRLEIADPVSALVMGVNLKSWKMEQFTVDARVQVKGKGIRKNFTFRDKPLKELAGDLKF
ncbi:MAG: hypothetical protein IJ383_08515 [Bacteroidales bacterium]|nr:hypothetical protein [Bacteroidales bacterium]